MTATEELLPCPFCGGEPSIKKYWNFDRESESFYVWCYDNDCVIEPMTRAYKKEDDAIKAWNTRVEVES